MKADASLIRTIYLYLFAFVGLVLVVIGLVRLLDLGLKVYVFREADQFAVYPAPERLDGSGSFSEEERERLRVEQERAERANTTSRRQATASSSLAMIIVGLPLFWYHWRIISKKS